jgi:hypothetical protein
MLEAMAAIAESVVEVNNLSRLGLGLQFTS